MEICSINFYILYRSIEKQRNERSLRIISKTKMERRYMQRKKLLKILHRWKVLFIRKQQSIYLGLLDVSIVKLYLINQWKYLVQSTIFFSNVKNKRRFMSILRNVFTWHCHLSCHNPEKSNIRQPITSVSCVCYMLSTWSLCLTLLTFLVEQNNTYHKLEWKSTYLFYRIFFHTSRMRNL